MLRGLGMRGGQLDTCNMAALEGWACESRVPTSAEEAQGAAWEAIGTIEGGTLPVAPSALL